MGRGLFADPNKIIVIDNDKIKEILEQLVNGDIIIIENIDPINSEIITRQPSSYGYISCSITPGKWIVEDIDNDPCVKCKNIRAIKLIPFDKQECFMVEYITTDGAIREIEGWTIVGKISKVIKLK